MSLPSDGRRKEESHEDKCSGYENDFLSEKGVTWDLVGESVKENNTVEHLEQLLEAAKSNGYDVFISPHYSSPRTTAGSSGALSRR